MDGEQWLNFRENMRYFRLIQGITGKEMAARMGKSVAWVSQVEAGLYARWPASKDMLAVARELGLSLKQMVTPLPSSIVLEVSNQEHDQGVKNLEKIRKHHKLSKRKFADKLGISRSCYSAVTNEYSRFSIESWWRIAKELNMDLKIFIGRDEQ